MITRHEPNENLGAATRGVEGNRIYLSSGTPLADAGIVDVEAENLLSFMAWWVMNSAHCAQGRCAHRFTLRQRRRRDLLRSQAFICLFGDYSGVRNIRFCLLSSPVSPKDLPG
jgi:hypothetical protein